MPDTTTPIFSLLQMEKSSQGSSTFHGELFNNIARLDAAIGSHRNRISGTTSTASIAAGATEIILIDASALFTDRLIVEGMPFEEDCSWYSINAEGYLGHIYTQGGENGPAISAANIPASGNVALIAVNRAPVGQILTLEYTIRPAVII